MTRRVRATNTKTAPKIKPAPVNKIKPHPDVWAEALRLAAGDCKRLQVCRDGAVIVRNP